MASAVVELATVPIKNEGSATNEAAELNQLTFDYSFTDSKESSARSPNSLLSDNTGAQRK